MQLVTAFQNMVYDICNNAEMKRDREKMDNEALVVASRKAAQELLQRLSVWLEGDMFSGFGENEVAAVIYKHVREQKEL